MMTDATMRAIRATPGDPQSVMCERQELPVPGASEVLVRTIAVGVCGTDREVLTDGSGPRITVGHEVLGRVEKAPIDSGLKPGELVVGVIRRPCGRCAPCEVGQVDQCQSGQLFERGIRHLDGYASDLWLSEPKYLVTVPPSLNELGIFVEPASSVFKGLRRMLDVNGGRPVRSVLVLGLGTIGLLATSVLISRGMDVTAVDPAVGLKHRLAHDRGAKVVAAITGLAEEFDALVDCSGDAQTVLDAIPHIGKGGRALLLGICSSGERLARTAVALRWLVLADIVLVGSVNASRQDYVEAAAFLASLPRDWLGRLITDQGEPSAWSDALENHQGVKTIIRFAQGTS